MASQGYRDWLAAGKPYELIRPAAALQRALRSHGLTVYDYPDARHLQADMPEDHTPFSVTGYPGSNRRWRARGLDVMPRGSTAGARRENAEIARQLIRDRDAGRPEVAWIKYINWTDENGVCRQERWTTDGQPNKRTTRSSTDKGHIHISGRSDLDSDTRADGYDPIKRMSGLAGDDEMSAEAESAVFRMDGRLAALFYGMGGNPYGQGPMKGEPNQVGAALARLEAQAAADATRDATMQAAIVTMGKTLDTALQGGGNIETGAVVAAVRQAAEQSRTAVEQLHAALVELRAENADLRARLATAFGSGSE